jgi:hypothetical protein
MDSHDRLLQKPNDLNRHDLFPQLFQSISILAHHTLGNLHLLGNRRIICRELDPILCFDNVKAVVFPTRSRSSISLGKITPTEFPTVVTFQTLILSPPHRPGPAFLGAERHYNAYNRSLGERVSCTFLSPSTHYACNQTQLVLKIPSRSA